MTVLEQRFLESVPKELHKLNENLSEIINLLKINSNGKDTK
jgi:hypothetical protein